MDNAKLNSIGKLWEKNGHRRLYVNRDVAMRLIGLDVARYKTGNISGATLDGELISNSAAGRIISALNNLYYDLGDGKLHYCCNCHAFDDEKLVTAIEEAIA